jgi:putative MATE family efflux protein
MALGGLSLVMPLMTIQIAFTLMFGVGSANLISIRLGQGQREQAENVLNHCFFLLLGGGLLLMILGLNFIDPLLTLMGAAPGSETLAYAKDYYRIILYGHVFSMLSFGSAHCTRAQGFPRISMISMFIGAGTNLVLDPLFIFVFHWGVQGAAFATIISQFVSMLWILSFNFSKKAEIRLRLNAFKPSLATAFQIIAFGSAQFLLQFAASGVQVVYNFSLIRYGAESLGVANGGDIALSGVNIVLSVNMMILMPIFGLNQGAQPILGFNYGAMKFGRVLSAYLRAVFAAVIFCGAGWIATQFFTLPIVKLFTPGGSSTLFEFASWAMHTITLLLPLVGFQIISSNLFTATGRPRISIVLSMLRQIIILIPCMLLLGKIWGLKGVVFSVPISDAISALLTTVMVSFELRKLRASAAQEEGSLVRESAC